MKVSFIVKPYCCGRKPVTVLERCRMYHSSWIIDSKLKFLGENLFLLMPVLTGNNKSNQTVNCFEMFLKRELGAWKELKRHLCEMWRQLKFHFIVVELKSSWSSLKQLSVVNSQRENVLFLGKLNVLSIIVSGLSVGLCLQHGQGSCLRSMTSLVWFRLGVMHLVELLSYCSILMLAVIVVIGKLIIFRGGAKEKKNKSEPVMFRQDPNAAYWRATPGAEGFFLGVHSPDTRIRQEQSETTSRNNN